MLPEIEGPDGLRFVPRKGSADGIRVKLYKLENVQGALRLHGARGGTLSGEPHVEAWQRTVLGSTYRVSVACQRSDFLLTEHEIDLAVYALFVRSGHRHDRE